MKPRQLYLVRALEVRQPGWPTDPQLLGLVLQAAATAPVPTLFIYDGQVFRFAPRTAQRRNR